MVSKGLMGAISVLLSRRLTGLGHSARHSQAATQSHHEKFHPRSRAASLTTM
jgi:hypothetical protein